MESELEETDRRVKSPCLFGGVLGMLVFSGLDNKSDGGKGIRAERKRIREQDAAILCITGGPARLEADA